MKVAHLTTVDLSLRYLILPQLTGVVDIGGESLGISASGPDVEDVESHGVRHVDLPGSTRSISPLNDAKAMLGLWKILRREDVDVLHTHTPKPGLYGRVIGRLAGVPAVLNTIHGLYATEDDPWIKKAIVYSLEAFASRFSHRELVQSPEDFEMIVERGITRADRTVLLGNGVDLKRFNANRFDADFRSAKRAELGIAPETFAVGIVGRLVAEKGYPELFEAFAQLPDRYALVTVGPYEPGKADGLTDDMVEAARARGVQFLGMRTDVDELYSAFDLFVLPSHREGFPRAAMEASASGLPVIATDIRGCRQVVDPDRNGLLIPVLDPTAIAQAILAIGENPQTAERYARAARTKAEEDFDEDEVVRIVLSEQVRALRESGRFEVFDPSPITIRRATPDDAFVLARLHSDGINTGFLPTLGMGFMRQLYSSMLSTDDVVALVAEDQFAPVGFVSGGVDTDAVFKRFIRTRGLRAAISAGWRLLNPRTIWRVFETLRYNGDEFEVPAELLSMAVAEPFRGRGISTQLGEAFLTELTELGAEAVKVVVGAANEVAIGAYGKMGFEPAGMIEVHKGEPSQVLIRQRA